MSDTAKSNYSRRWRWVLLIVVCCAGFWPSLHAGFVLDDDLLLTDADVVKLPDGLYRIWFTTQATDYYPVTNSSFWLEWRLWGANPMGYHVTNLMLHIATAILLCVVLEQLAVPGAFLAALLFAVHPVNVESVVWIAQRKNLLALLFALVSTLCWLKGSFSGGVVDEAHAGKSTGNENLSDSQSVAGAGKWYWLSVVAFLLAMLSKGSVAVLAVLLLWITWWQRPLVKRDFLRAAPLFVIAAVLTAVNIWSQSHEPDAIRQADFVQRLLGAGAVVWFYLYKAVLPIQLSFVYPQWSIRADSALWWLPLAVCVAVTVVLWWKRRVPWVRAVLFAWGFFCIALLPVMGFTDVGYMRYSLVADHYQHLALIAVVALLAAAVTVWADMLKRSIHAWRAAGLKGVVMVVIALLAILTWNQSSLYVDAATLYADTIRKNPECWLAYSNLAAWEYKAGQTDEAERHARRALELNLNFPQAYDVLGNVLMRQGKTDAAIAEFETSLQIRPDLPVTHTSLGAALASAGRYGDAVAQGLQAIKERPNYPLAHYNLGVALLNMDQTSAAIEQFETALQLDPRWAEAHVNLGLAMASRGESAEAIQHFQQALQINPEMTQAEMNLAIAYDALHEPEQALAAAQHALELARKQQNSDLATQIQTWLTDFEARQKQPNPQLH